MNTIKFVLMSDEQKIFDGEVEKIVIESDSGIEELLPKHIPMLSKVYKKISYISENKELSHEFTEGFIYTSGDVCFAIVDS